MIMDIKGEMRHVEHEVECAIVLSSYLEQSSRLLYNWHFQYTYRELKSSVRELIHGKMCTML